MKKINKFLAVLSFTLVLSILSGTEIYAQSATLCVPERFQEHSQWCWAGSAQAVLDYYLTFVAQCDMADWAWGRDDCCGNTDFWWDHDCNQPNSMYSSSGSLQAIMAHWGVNSNSHGSHRTWAQVIAQINSLRPFVMRFGWSGGGGHFLVGYGYDHTGGNHLSYMDPWPGNGYTRSLYTWVVSAAGHHDWTHTLEVTTSAPNHQPTADICQDDMTNIECQGNYEATIPGLDGTCSSDCDGDALSYNWYSCGCNIDNPTGATTDVTCMLGNNAVSLDVYDGSLYSDPDSINIEVVDTTPPTGGITDPPDGSCHLGPVTIESSFTDICDPGPLAISYDPPGGPTYNTHGDYTVDVWATDSSGNNSDKDTVSFTIDKQSPVVNIIWPMPTGLTPLPHVIPFNLVFTSSDDDGAANGVEYEAVYIGDLSGDCPFPIYDGSSYGDMDGVLHDDNIMVNVSELCRIADLCDISVLHHPKFTVKVYDCAGNEGEDSIQFMDVHIKLKPGLCGGGSSFRQIQQVETSQGTTTKAAVRK